MRVTDFTAAMVEEYMLARQKHAPMHSHHEAYAIILEELEEYKEQVFMQYHARSREKILKELVQAATMCMAAAIELL